MMVCVQVIRTALENNFNDLQSYNKPFGLDMKFISLLLFFLLYLDPLTINKPTPNPDVAKLLMI